MASQSIPPIVRPHKRPASPLPANAADCHMHVFGPFERYPLAARRSYDVPDGPLAAHEAMKRDVGLARTVIVQPSGYDTDNRCTLAALAELGPRGRAVVVVEPDIAESELDAMHRAGARGVRLNLVTLKTRYSDPAGLIATFAKRLKPRGWHLQIFCENALIAELERLLAEAPMDVVIDHMGLPDARQGLDQPGFQALLRLLGRGHVWAKLAGADRVTQHTGKLADALPFMRALADSNVDRLVWGSDWPHIGFHPGGAHGGKPPFLLHRPLDAGELLDLLSTAVPDPARREKILSTNPARLYQFG
jgi:predicted TIM-barrel fold metal-dependent hydrolase